MQIVEYAKAHPIATGAIVIIGGFLFIMIVSGGGGGSSQAVDNGPSDAEVAANATIQAAQIQAQAAAQTASIGAGVQLNSDNKAAEVAMSQIEGAKAVQLAIVGAQSDAVKLSLQQQQQRTNAIIGSLGSLNKNNRDDVLQALITGEKFNEGQGSTRGLNIGSALSGAGSLISSIGSVFSDQRLKENIRFAGYDRKGREVYRFNYKGSKRERLGYISDSLKRTDPERVFTDPATGYDKVDGMLYV